LNKFARRNLFMPESIFRHTHRVIYAECTVGNHVYYSRYLDILEGARGEFLRQLGRTALQWQQAGIAFPVIGVEISYKGPARYDDLLTIELWVAAMGGVRLNVVFRILNAAGALLAEGVTRHVCATTDEKPKRLPPELIESLRPFLKKSE
jgi:acyl-CoA thioester hydrolase